MSAFVSIRLPDSVQVLADGAAYNRDGVITSFENKLRISSKVPVAIAVRGASGNALHHAQVLCDYADEHGVIALIKALNDYETNLDVRRHFKADDKAGFDFAIGLWHPDHGPTHYRIHSYREIDGQPFKLRDWGDLVACGSVFDPQELFRLGVLPVRGDGAIWGRTEAPKIMDLMRTIPSEPLPGTDDNGGYRIGGHVDVASVTQSGVVLTRVRKWADKVNEAIVPVGSRDAALKGNRRERRAAGKAGRGRRAA